MNEEIKGKVLVLGPIQSGGWKEDNQIQRKVRKL